MPTSHVIYCRDWVQFGAKIRGIIDGATQVAHKSSKQDSINFKRMAINVLYLNNTFWYNLYVCDKNLTNNTKTYADEWKKSQITHKDGSTAKIY